MMRNAGTISTLLLTIAASALSAATAPAGDLLDVPPGEVRGAQAQHHRVG